MSVIVKTCGCGRAYTPDEWEALEPRGWMGDGEAHALELRNCVCRSTIAIPVKRSQLEAIVDGLKANVTYQALTHGGWHARVTGIDLPPHVGLGPTAAAALAEVLTFAQRIGWLK